MVRELINSAPKGHGSYEEQKGNGDEDISNLTKPSFWAIGASPASGQENVASQSIFFRGEEMGPSKDYRDSRACDDTCSPLLPLSPLENL